MNSETVSRWLGVGANFGVLLGLFLLWTEISQNKQITRVELGAGQADSPSLTVAGCARNGRAGYW